MVMRRRRVAWLVAGVLAAPTVRGEPLQELFRRAGQPPFVAGKTVRVTDGPLQIALTPTLVLAAATGAEFIIAPQEGMPTAIHVGDGTVQLVDMERNRIAPLAPGSYVLGAPGATGVDAGAMAAGAPFERQTFRFGDYILVRQDEYVNSLGMSIEPINQVILGFLRGLFRRSR